MSVTYGVTSQGFVRKPLLQIIADLSAAQRANIAATLDTSAESVLGQLNGIFANALGENWEQLEICYHAFDPDAAEDLLLTMLAKITGTIRRPATPSTVPLICDLDAGTVLVAGTHYAAVDGALTIRWTPAADYTAVSGGDQTVNFVSELLGPVAGFEGTIIVIATPVSGWNSVTNAVDASPGIVADTDPTLRLRREQELAAGGSATTRAIAAKCIAAFPGILNITVFENDTDFTDGVTGNPPHSIEVLIYDGPDPTVDNDALAQVIENTKAGGIQTCGNASGTATIDAAGHTQTIYFSRSTQLLIYASYTLETTTGYIGDTAVKDSVATQANARYQPGGSVIAIFVKALPIEMDGVEDITAFALGTAPSPVGTVNIPVGLRQIAIFDTSRIAITDA
jgi:uncharacterized phage protein gp47/JayE